MNVITCQYNGLMENIVSLKRVHTIITSVGWVELLENPGSIMKSPIVLGSERSSLTAVRSIVSPSEQPLVQRL